MRKSHRYGERMNSIDTDTILVRDVVLVYYEDRPQGFCRLGKVEDVTYGADVHIGSAVVRVHSRVTQSTLVKCPLRCLYSVNYNGGDDNVAQLIVGMILRSCPK